MQPTIKTKQYELWLGDCREVLPLLSGIDAVVTDPPYGVELESKRAKQRGGAVTTHGTDCAYEDTPEYIRDVVVPAIEVCRKIASCVVLTPGTRNYWQYPAPAEMGCFYSSAGTGLGRWGFSCMQPILYYGKDPYLANGLGARANSCGQTYPNDANKVEHPCAKPIRMMTWLVNRASLEGMTVLDPFMGSGTTGVTCIELGRYFIGIEKEPKYFEIAAKRLEQAAAQGALFQPEPVAAPVQMQLVG